jgi:2'-5' RNA ligase
MTLAFMPAVDARRSVDVERITRAAAAAHRRFPLALTGRIDRFGAKVAWAELAASPALEALATSSRRGLATGGIAMEERAFHPHVTLARAGRRRIDAAMVDRLSAPHTSWWVSSVKLIESQLGGGPARWRTVGDYPLAS